MNRIRPICGLLVIALLALLFNLNGWGVLEASEARYAEISREMFRSGDWLHPTLLNIYHYHKPPVTFWLTGLGFQLFGVNAFGARFFLQLSLLAQGVLVYLIGDRLFESQRRSLLAALIYLSFPLSLIGARNLTTDSFLTTCVLAVVYCMSAYYAQRRVWGIYGSALFIGLGFLIKGPAVFVVPFFFWGYLMLARKMDYRVPIQHLAIALILCLGIGLSWYIYVIQQVPGLGDYFIGQQVVARVTDDQAFNRAKPAWYYPLVLVTTSLPWCLLYATSLLQFKHSLFKSVEVRQMLLYWLLLPFLVFALSSSKLMMYLLPLYPGMALVLACLLANAPRLDRMRLARIFLIFYSGLGLLLLFGPMMAQGLGGEIAVTGPMIFSALLILLAPFVAARLRSQLDLKLGLTALFSTLAIAIYSSYFLGANELLLGGTRPLAQFIQAQGLQAAPVLVYGKLLPSLAFNLDRDIITISDDSEGKGVERELQFQFDDRWEQYWIYPEQPDAMKRWEELVRSPSVLITQGNVPENRRELFSSYPQSTAMGRWTIYYRPN